MSQAAGIHFSVLRWSSWASSLGATQCKGPELPEVPAMQRRRLSRLSKIALRVALDLDAPGESLSTVFASRHGELTRTLALLSECVDGNDLSPTQFSQSVHNTSSGLFSILRQLTTPSTVVTAGAMTLPMAVIEAVLQSQRQQQPVLLVYADEPVPELFDDYVDEPQQSLGLALVVDAKGREYMAMARSVADAAPPVAHPAVQFEQMLAASQSGLSCRLGQSAWCWQVHRG